MRIQKEIDNVERVKNRVATVPLTMEDAVEFHKQVVDRIEKDRKDINKELGIGDVEEDGFTGASKEPKKVSTPELKKMKLSESLFESLNEAVPTGKRVLQISMDVLLDGGMSAGSVIEHIKESTGLDILGYDAEYDLTQEYNDSGWSEALPESKRVLQISMDVLLDDTTSADSVVEQIKKATDLDILGYNAEYDLTQEYVDSGWFNESLNEDVESISIPAPYDKYFELEDEDQLEEYGWTKGEQIPNYDCHILAMLYPKDDEIDVYPILTDDPDYPVCELAGGRLYPVKIQGRWKRLIKDESLNEELEDTDGWGDEIEYILSESFSELENLMYEVRNCRRGSYTSCETAEELADYIHRLAEDLDECSYEIKANSKNINEDYDSDLELIRAEERRKKQKAFNDLGKEHDWEKEFERAKFEHEKAGGDPDDLDFTGWVKEMGYSDNEYNQIMQYINNKQQEKEYEDKLKADEQAREKAEKEKKEAEEVKAKRTEKATNIIGKAGEMPSKLVDAAKKGLSGPGIHLNF